MTDIVLVRHGETEFNREGVFRGRYDVGLNEVGREQPRRRRQRLLASRSRPSIPVLFCAPSTPRAR